MSLAKQGGRIAKIPSVTYLIENLQMFSFQGTKMLLIAFENKTVQVFEAQNGHFAHEFHFQDNVFDQFGLKPDEEENEKKVREKKRLEEMEQQKSGLSRIEMNYLKRKRLRERGEYKPPIPAFTPVVKSLM